MRGALATIAGEGKYLYGRPGVNVQRLGRFLTAATEAELVKGLKSHEAPVRANSLLLLSWGHRHNVQAEAFEILKDRGLVDSLRLCAILALINSRDSTLVPDLIPLLDKSDDMYNNLLDAVGALCDESHLKTVLPLILKADSMLSNAFYHFRELRSRDALLQTLKYFAANTRELADIGREGYLEPIIGLIPQYFDRDIAAVFANIIANIEAHNIVLFGSGIGLTMFNLVSNADTEGLCARLYLEQIVDGVEQGTKKPFYFSDQLAASLVKPKTADWLIERRATKTIQILARFLGPEMRNILRPHSDGWIDKMEENTRVYEGERAKDQESRNNRIFGLQDKLVTESDFNQALNDFHQLTMSHWPELPVPFRDWIERETSKLMNKLDLEHSSSFVGNSVRYPVVLPILIKLIERYELKIDPDVPMVFCTTIWYEAQVTNYYRRFGFSEKALETLTRLIRTPKSSHALSGTIAFVRASKLWSTEIGTALKSVVGGRAEPGPQAEALRLLSAHDEDVEFLDGVVRNSVAAELREVAFLKLVELQHRPTIERALSELLGNDNALKAGERNPPIDMPHGWILKVRSEIYIDKLAKLRERALTLELPGEVDLITRALTQIDRGKAAAIIKSQIAKAPESWKRAQQYIAIEEERTAKIEKVQNAPFNTVLRKLRGSTTLRRLKLVCEGQSDLPVFKEFLSQIPDLPEIEFDFVGGWPNLAGKDTKYFQHGCNEAYVVMDGDNGRVLSKSKKPLTDIARAQQKRLVGHPVQLRVLERYGIENYFSKGALERVTGIALTAYFPIPDHVAAVEYLREMQHDWKFRIKRFLVSRFHMNFRFTGRALYFKGRNGEVAKLMSLEKDLNGTDLFDIIHEIGARAKDLAE